MSPIKDLNPKKNDPYEMKRISNVVEHWTISYYFEHTKIINENISIPNKISKLEEILELPINYHEKLKQFTNNFNESFSEFLKKEKGQKIYIQTPYTHPVDKVRTTKENIDYISFTGAVGIRKLPLDETLRGTGHVFIDTTHPITLIAPDNTIYKYWGINTMPGTMIKDGKTYRT